MKHSAAILALSVAGLLSACGGSDSDGQEDLQPTPETPTPEQPAPQPEQPQQPADPVPALTFGVLPDTQGGASSTSQHPMRAILDLYKQQGVDVVLVAGDLGEDGTPAEYRQWREVADDYTSDMAFLPIMGNHDNKGKDQDWHDWIGAIIPADATHMDGSRNKNYSWVKDNVLFINISYGWLAFAYDFENEILRHRDHVDHIILQTHNSFVGNKYGLVREKIVEGYLQEESDVKFLEYYDRFRDLLATHDVIYVSGHEHMYARSLIRDSVNRSFTQIISGNASYKGYENRFGEHEQVQYTVMLKASTEDTGTLDVTAPIFRTAGDRIDYSAYYAGHSIRSNAEGPKELASPQWKLFDRFSRSADRCEKIVFPSSIPPGSQLYNIYDATYRTSACASTGGSVARILDGTNQTFNRHDTRTRTMSAEPGVSLYSGNLEMLSAMYRYMFVSHASWRPNLNNSQRARIVAAGTPDEEVEIRGTTIDLKKHLVLAWQPKSDEVVSDILTVSGIAGQGGTYIDPWGRPKNIESDTGLPGSRGDGSEAGKAPVALPAWASRSWTLSQDGAGDPFVLEFAVPDSVSAESATLARRDPTTGEWQPLVDPVCISKSAYVPAYLTQAPSDLTGSCVADVVVGHDAGSGAFWARIQHEGEFALVARR